MNAFWLLFLALTFSPANAGWQDYVPSEGTLEKARSWVLDHTSQPVHLFLFEHLPKFFPVSFICKLQTGAQGRVVMPREPEFSAEPGAELFCPDLARITLKTKSTVNVNYDQELPVIAINSGSADISPLGTGFVIRSGESSFKLVKTSGQATLKLRITEAGTLLYSDHGQIDGAFSATGANLKFFLGTVRGRIGLTSSGFAGTKYIFAREIFSPLDMALSREQLSALNFQKTWDTMGFNSAENGIGLMLAWIPGAANSPTVDISLNGPPGAFKCQLFSRNGEEKEFVKAYEFPADHMHQLFRLKLHPDYAKYFLNVGCTDDSKNVIFSNELPPLLMAHPVPGPGPVAPGSVPAKK